MSAGWFFTFAALAWAVGCALAKPEGWNILIGAAIGFADAIAVDRIMEKRS